MILQKDLILDRIFDIIDMIFIKIFYPRNTIIKAAPHSFNYCHQIEYKNGMYSRSEKSAGYQNGTNN